MVGQDVRNMPQHQMLFLGFDVNINLEKYENCENFDDNIVVRCYNKINKKCVNCHCNFSDQKHLKLNRE